MRRVYLVLSLVVFATNETFAGNGYKGGESSQSNVPSSVSAPAGGAVGRKSAISNSKRVVGVSVDYPAESDEDARMFSNRDEAVRGYVYYRSKKRSGTYLLTKEGKPIEEDEVKTLKDAGDELRGASSVVTEVALDRNMSRTEEDIAIANAAKEAFKKTWQYGEWKIRMKSQIERHTPYTNDDLLPGYVLIRGCSGNTRIFRINPKRMLSGEMRDVTAGNYYNDRKNSFLRDRRFLNAAESINEAKNDSEHHRMMQEINETWTLRGDISAHPASKPACPQSNPLFPELDAVVCGNEGKVDASKGTAANADKKIKNPDLSKLFGVMKRIIECLRKIDAMSSKPSDGDFAEYNKLAGKCAEEAVAIAKVIEDEIGKMNLTEEEKIKFGKKIGEQIEKRYGEELKTYSSTIKSLQKQIEAKGYGDFKTTNIGLDFKAKYLN